MQNICKNSILYFVCIKTTKYPALSTEIPVHDMKGGDKQEIAEIMTASTVAKEKKQDNAREIRRYREEVPVTGRKRKDTEPAPREAKAATRPKRRPAAKTGRRETELRLIKSEEKPPKPKAGPAGNKDTKKPAMAGRNRAGQADLQSGSMKKNAGAHAADARRKKKKPRAAAHRMDRANQRPMRQDTKSSAAGASARKRPPASMARRRTDARKKTKARAIWKFLLPACLACITAGFVLWYLSFDNLLPSEYIDVTYSGYDSKGTAALSIQETEEYAAFWENTQVRLLSENGNLKNGDVLDVRLVYDEEKAREEKVRIKEDSFQIEVSGLPQGRELSPELLFQDVHAIYEGTAPELSVTITNESSDPFLQTVTYEIQEPKELYDIGDTFTVTAAFSPEEAISHEYAVVEGGYSKEFTVENADRYLRDASQLAQEQIDTLHETAVSLFGDANEYGLRIFSEANLMPIWINGKNTFKWSNPRLISAYLNVLKPEYFQTIQSHNNDIKLVYKATLSQADGVACTAEVVVQFHDLILKADGTYDLALDSGKIIAASFRDSHIRDLVTDTYAQEYEAEKLTLP